MKKSSKELGMAIVDVIKNYMDYSEDPAIVVTFAPASNPTKWHIVANVQVPDAVKLLEQGIKTLTRGEEQWQDQQN